MLISLLTAAVLMAANTAPPTQVLHAERISQSVETELLHRLATLGIDPELKLAGRLADQTLPVGEAEIEVGTVAGRWPRPRVGVPVRLRVDGHVVRTLTVWVDLQDARKVLTYAEAYPVHANGIQLRLQPATVDMMCCSGESLDLTVAMNNRRLKRPVMAGAPVMATDFESIPDVIAQEPIVIEVTHGAVRVVARGIALSDGSIGDSVQVRPLSGHASVQSRVIAKQKVQVDD